MIVTDIVCGTKWSHADRRGHCTGCHATFSGQSLFDAHHVRDGDGWRCLVAAEMADRGWRLVAATTQEAAWDEWRGPEREDFPLAAPGETTPVEV